MRAFNSPFFGAFNSPNYSKKILYLSNLVDQLTKNYKSIQPEVSFLTMGFNYNEKFGFFILLKHLIVPMGAFNSPMYKRD